MEPDGRPPVNSCLVRRRDYGYPPFPPCGWPCFDLLWEALPALQESPSGLVLRNGELLLGWARSRSRPGLFVELARFAKRRGLVLECRFPRPARTLLAAMEEAGASPRWDDLPPGGAIPPLYQDLPAGSPLRRLHLELEWRTGLAAARGGVALLRIGALLAPGPRRAGEVARELGVTAGAARSYLSWMEDAGLVRREGAAFALRHPLLSLLFVSPAPREEGRGPSRPPSWDPVELD